MSKVEKQSFLNKVKALFETETETTVENTDETVEQEFKDYKTEDGKIVRSESLDEGNKIEEIDADGEVIDLKNGTYTIKEEKKTIKVEDSKITEVVEIEDESEVENESVDEDTETFETAELEDGTIIEYENLEVGTQVNKINEDGEKEAVGEGTHQTKEGDVIVTDSDGKIVEVKKAETEEEAPNFSIENKEDFNSMIEDWFLNKLESEEFKTIVSKFESIEKLEKENKELREEFKKFAKTPQDKSVTEKKSDFKNMDREAKLKYFSKK